MKRTFRKNGKTAEYFGFKFSKPEIIPEKDGILRILLHKDGKITKEYKPLLSHTTNKITISSVKVNSSNEFLYHKTTYRPWFYESYQKITNNEIYDEIFFNEKGELTEGARSNIILQINGKLYTPPVKCGLLNGIYRQSMKNITEKFCINQTFSRRKKSFALIQSAELSR